MFERFTKPTPKEEEKEILNRVSQEGPENTDTSTNETEEKVVPDGPDEKSIEHFQMKRLLKGLRGLQIHTDLESLSKSIYIPGFRSRCLKLK